MQHFLQWPWSRSQFRVKEIFEISLNSNGYKMPSLQYFWRQSFTGLNIFSVYLVLKNVNWNFGCWCYTFQTNYFVINMNQALNLFLNFWNSFYISIVYEMMIKLHINLVKNLITSKLHFYNRGDNFLDYHIYRIYIILYILGRDI